MRAQRNFSIAIVVTLHQLVMGPALADDLVPALQTYLSSQSITSPEDAKVALGAIPFAEATAAERKTAAKFLLGKTGMDGGMASHVNYNRLGLALASLGAEGVAQVPALVAYLTSKEDTHVSSAPEHVCGMLLALGPKAQAALPVLIKKAQYGGGPNAYACHVAIAAIGPDDPRVAKLILGFLASKKTSDLRKAVSLLDELKMPRPFRARTLEVMRSPNTPLEIRVQLAHSFLQRTTESDLGEGPAAEVMQAYLNPKEDFGAYMSERLMFERFPGTLRKLTPKIFVKTKSPSESERAAMALLLGLLRVDTPEVVSRLREMGEDRDQHAGSLAVLALVLLGKDAMVEADISARTDVFRAAVKAAENQAAVLQNSVKAGLPSDLEGRLKKLADHPRVVKTPTELGQMTTPASWGQSGCSGSPKRVPSCASLRTPNAYATHAMIASDGSVLFALHSGAAVLTHELSVDPAATCEANFALRGAATYFEVGPLFSLSGKPTTLVKRRNGGGSEQRVLLALKQDGRKSFERDLPFSQIPFERVFGHSVHDDGRLDLSGELIRRRNPHVVRLKSDGTIDESFTTPMSLVPYERVGYFTALAALSGGRLFAAGWVDALGDYKIKNGWVVLSSDGQPIPDFAWDDPLGMLSGGMVQAGIQSGNGGLFVIRETATFSSGLGKVWPRGTKKGEALPEIVFSNSQAQECCSPVIRTVKELPRGGLIVAGAFNQYKFRGVTYPAKGLLIIAEGKVQTTLLAKATAIAESLEFFDARIMEGGDLIVAGCVGHVGDGAPVAARFSSSGELRKKCQ